jgi:hypothetical protein
MMWIHCFVLILPVKKNRKSRNQVSSPLSSFTDRAEITRPSPPNSSVSTITAGCDTINNSISGTPYSESRTGDSVSTRSPSVQLSTIDYKDAVYDLPIDDETEETASHIGPGAQSTMLEQAADEEKHFEFFLSELSKCFPYVNLFPWAAARLFSTSHHNPALRESVLSVAALTANNDLEQGHARALQHLTKALQFLQTRIHTVEIDEGLAISSFLLAHFSLMLGDHLGAKTHLKGMVTVLAKLDPEGMRESVLSPLTIDPLTMLIWRMAKRIDFITSIASGEPPVLPRFPPQ